MAAHTSGPWKRIGTDVYGAGCLVSRAPSVATYSGSVTALEQATADARLIAAAPELLVELKAFEQLITGLSDDKGFHLNVVPIRIERVQSIRAAIAKAEGRS